MARISTYSKDLIITKDDKVIGSDASGSITKNYTLEGIAKFLSENGLISVHTQASYQLSTTSGEKKFTGASSGTSFASVSSLQFSKIDGAEHNMENFILDYKGEAVILFQTDDKNIYGIYEVENVVQNSSDSNFYDFTLTYISGNGALTVDKYYSLAFVGDGDKHFEFDQSSASATWDIQHNLNKFPSVSIALPSGQKGYGDVTYINKNRLTVSFISAESGKAYMN